MNNVNKYIAGILLQILWCMALQAQITGVEYFIDTDPGPGLADEIAITPGNSIDETFVISVAGHEAGFHLLGMRARDATGAWGAIKVRLIYLQPQSYGIPAPGGFDNLLVEGEYFIDSDPGEGHGTVLSFVLGEEVDIARTLATDMLPAGTYTAGMRVRQLDGQWSSTFGVTFDVDSVIVSCDVPGVDFTYTAGNANDEITFTNTSTDLSPTATYVWDVFADGTTDAATQNAAYTFTQPGTYPVKLTITNDSIECTTSLIKLLQIGPSDPATIAVDGAMSFCAGDSVTLTAPAGSNWLWSTGHQGIELTVGTSGTYSVVYDDPYGVQRVSNEVSVSVIDTMTIILAATDETNNTQNGSAAVDATSPHTFDLTYNWSGGSQLSSAVQLAAGPYTVTVDDGYCPDTLEFTIANVTTAGDGIVAAEYFFDADPGPGNATPYNIAQGAFSETYFQLDLAAIDPGFHLLAFRVQTIDGAWSPARSTQVFVIDPADPLPPPEDWGDIAALSYYFDEEPGVENGTEIPVVPPQAVIDDGYEISFAGLMPGLHTLYVRPQTEAGAWGIETTIDVIIDLMLPVVDTHMYPLCDAEYFFNNDPGEGHGVPLIIPVNDFIQTLRIAYPDTLAAGDHLLGIRVKSLNGQWSAVATTQFSLYTPACTLPGPSFSYSNVNAGEEMTLTNTSSGVTGGTTYAWDIHADGTVDATTENTAYTFATAGTYDVALRVQNDAACFKSIVQQVIVGSSPDNSISFAGATELCDGDSIVLTAPAGTDHLWSTGAETTSIVVKNSGKYAVSYVDINGQIRKSNTVFVGFHPTLEIDVVASPANSPLTNGSALVHVEGGTGFSRDYLWSTGDTIPSVGGLAAGNHVLTVTDAWCPDTVQVMIDDIGVVPDGIVAAEYFVETDPGAGQGIPVEVTHDAAINSVFDMDLSALDPGLHTLHFRVQRASGLWSATRRLPVVVADETTTPDTTRPEIVAAQYFYFDDHGVTAAGDWPDVIATMEMSQSFSLDTDTLPYGVHTAYIRVMDDEGKWSSPASIIIVKELGIPTPDTLPYPVVAAEVFFGADPGLGNAIPVDLGPGAVINATRAADISGLPSGTHTGYLRVKLLNGLWSTVEPFEFVIFETGCLPPSVDFSQTTAGAGQPMTLTSTSTLTEPDATYAWDVDLDGTTDYTTASVEHVFATAGYHDVRLRVSNGVVCFSTVIKPVYVGTSPDNAITAGGPTTLCSPDSVQLTAPTGTDYLWSTGDTTPAIWVHTTGAYQVWYKDASGLVRMSAPLSVTVHPGVVVDLVTSGSNGGADNGSANVYTLPGQNAEAYDYLWSTGDTLPMVTDLAPGMYQVTVSNMYCQEVLIAHISDLGTLAPPKLIAAEYFMGDIDPGPGNGTAIQIPQDAQINAFFTEDMTGLPAGIYNLHFRAQASTGLWSPTRALRMTISDLPMPIPNERPDIVAMEFFFASSDPGEGHAIPMAVAADTAIIHSASIPVDTLAVGEHPFYIRALDSFGEWGMIAGGTFRICDQPEMTVTDPTVTACVGTNLQLMATGDPGVTFYWTGPNGFESSEQNPLITNISTAYTGTFLSFAVVDGNCLSEPAEVTVTVHELPADPDTIYDTFFECGEATVFFVPPITHATNYDWTFPSEVTIYSGNNTNNIAVGFENYTGAFDLQVRGTNACADGNYSPAKSLSTCDCDEVLSGNDSGLSTLRNAVFCALADDMIAIDQTMLGEPIEISTGAIVIDKDLSISALEGQMFAIESTGGHPVFEVGAGSVFELENAMVTGGTSTTGSAIHNSGTTTISNSVFAVNSGAMSVGSLISNEGTVVIENNVEVRQE